MIKKIVVIDDDPVGVALLQNRLVKAGYEVAAERNGQAGLARVLKDKPDLVILDVEMPEMNGYTFMLELRKHQQFQELPVIVLTAHEENKRIFERRGIRYYLTKPVNFDDLFAKIGTISNPNQG